MKAEGQIILLVRNMDDRKTRYITAKKLSQMFRNVSFSEWKSKLDSGGATVVLRSDNMGAVEAYKRSLEMVGAEMEIVDQKTVGGTRVF